VRPRPGADRGTLVFLPVAVGERAGSPAVHAGDPVPPGYSIEWLTRRPVLGGLINEYERAA
jgi:hypothetical protein